MPLTTQHVVVCVISNGEDVRRGFWAPLAFVGSNNLRLVHRQPLVGVYSHAEQARVGLERKTRQGRTIDSQGVRKKKIWINQEETGVASFWSDLELWLEVLEIQIKGWNSSLLSDFLLAINDISIKDINHRIMEWPALKKTTMIT